MIESLKSAQGVWQDPARKNHLFPRDAYIIGLYHSRE